MFLIEILSETLDLFLEMAPYLLIGLIFVAVLNMFISKELLIKHVGKDNFMSVFKAALIGVPLPLCSCGVVPTGVYMANNGASRGSTVSFLISTPQTGIDSMIATYGMLGWLFAIFRPVAAFIMGILGGLVVSFTDKKKENKRSEKKENAGLNVLGTVTNLNVMDESRNTKPEACDFGCDDDENDKTVIGSIKYAFVNFLDDISVQFLIGLLISGVIAYALPEGFFDNSLVSSGIAGMLVIILVGVPMYVCATASIPIAVTLMMKGFSPGVAFVFLAVGPATNAASFTVIMNAIGKKTAVIYVLVISAGAIIFGYILDFLFALFNIQPEVFIKHIHNHNNLLTDDIKLILGIIFFILLTTSVYRKFFNFGSKKDREDKMDNARKITVEGMTCNHCVETVRRTIEQVPGIEKVDVSLKDKSAYVKGSYNMSDIENAVKSVGYKVVN